MQQLYAIFISRQLTGNFKEAIVPYIMESLKQIKKIDKANKKHDLEKMTNTELSEMVERLKRYAQIFNEQNVPENSNFTLNENESADLNQPEVESLMLKVRLNIFFHVLIFSVSGHIRRLFRNGNAIRINGLLCSGFPISCLIYFNKQFC